MTSLTEVGDWLRAGPRAWGDIPADYRAAPEAALLPAPAFTADQRHWLDRWWLACTQADVDAINALLPAGVQVAATDVVGSLYLGSDLLTDSLVAGNTYYPAQAVLFGLVCTYIDPPPQPPQEAFP